MQAVCCISIWRTAPNLTPLMVSQSINHVRRLSAVLKSRASSSNVNTTRPLAVQAEIDATTPVREWVDPQRCRCSYGRLVWKDLRKVSFAVRATDLRIRNRRSMSLCTPRWRSSFRRTPSCSAKDEKNAEALKRLIFFSLWHVDPKAHQTCWNLHEP
jgi:hypothetical protein